MTDLIDEREAEADHSSEDQGRGEHGRWRCAEVRELASTRLARIEPEQLGAFAGEAVGDARRGGAGGVGLRYPLQGVRQWATSSCLGKAGRRWRQHRHLTPEVGST